MDNKEKETLVIQPVNFSGKSLDKLYRIVKRMNDEFVKTEENRKKERRLP